MLLEGGSFYHVKVLHYVESVSNYIVSGVRLPDGTQLRPITNSYLWLNIPGNIICLHCINDNFDALIMTTDHFTITPWAQFST